MDSTSRSEGNRDIYERSDAVEMYTLPRPPHAGEEAQLAPFEAVLPQAQLLDIGIGGGRTTAWLAPQVAHYVGIDYATALVDSARARFPGLRIEWGDARDLSAYGDGSFDFVNFSFNGLDSLDHEGRLQVLSEVRRVLVPEGHFTFSSHNRDYHRRGLLPWQPPFKPGRVMLTKSAEAWRHRENWRRLRKAQTETTDYALVNDEAHDYSLLNYYISPAAQRAQLDAAGFTDVRVHDQWGRETTVPSPRSIWMYYSARRA